MALATSCNDGTVLDSVRLKPRSQGFNHDKKHRKKAMTNYITPNANYDLFSTASYAALDTYLKNDAIVKFKTVLDTPDFRGLS